jgi:hypothetical protein
VTETSRPWLGDTIGDCGPYSNDQWTQSWREAWLGAKANRGPLIGSGTSPDEGLWVRANSPAGASVVVSPGGALVHGVHYHNSADVVLAIVANTSGLTRIDSIILRKDWTSQTVRLIVKPGLPAASPVAPGLTQTDGVLWEIPLADITVVDSFVSITQAEIRPNRHYANAADGVYLYDVLNNSGVTLQTGDVVVWDATANRAVKTTTTWMDPDVAGVWVGRTPAAGYGRILVRGIGYVLTHAAIAARYQPLVTNTVAKEATSTTFNAASTSLSTIGVSLEITAAGGLCLAFVDVPVKRMPAVAIVNIATGAITTNSALLVAMDAANLKATLNTTRPNLLISFTATYYQASGTVSNTATIAIDVDGTKHAIGIAYMHLPVGSVKLITFTILITGLLPGQHVVTPFWLVSGDSVGITGSAAAPDILSVIEV